ncbi:MRP-L47-domain-containing protein [Exidia glandulosa HHB12029]|uniref:Large ribosomal subunit protein uL29m n=1 Tax=Exidia glandulosa HHB12029 TaxID=1314781 RepID=A0A165QBU7_EXIGL|nr:MRP-L47-domain-containing protein [Exidia glandulosa HHB12029]
MVLRERDGQRERKLWTPPQRAFPVRMRVNTHILRRTLATVVDAPGPAIRHAPGPVVAGAHKPGALRPHLGFETAPNHPLWAFFRRNEAGEPVAVDKPPDDLRQSGRGWNVDEIRRKSFRDLHTLWYICLRERNLLATQKAFAKKMAFSGHQHFIMQNEAKCRKTMGYIKLVLSERRSALVKALTVRDAPPAPESKPAVVAKKGRRRGRNKREDPVARPPTPTPESAAQSIFEAA